MTLTALSVLVALLIGSLEALGLLASQLGLRGWFFGLVATLER